MFSSVREVPEHQSVGAAPQLAGNSLCALGGKGGVQREINSPVLRLTPPSYSQALVTGAALHSLVVADYN